jgi:hypothetical protein
MKYMYRFGIEQFEPACDSKWTIEDRSISSSRTGIGIYWQLIICFDYFFFKYDDLAGFLISKKKNETLKNASLKRSNLSNESYKGIISVNHDYAVILLVFKS